MAQMIINPSKCPKCGKLQFFPDRPGKKPYYTIFKCHACGHEEELEAKKNDYKTNKETN